jgi:hypothetical protein
MMCKRCLAQHDTLAALTGHLTAHHGVRPAAAGREARIERGRFVARPIPRAILYEIRRKMGAYRSWHMGRLLQHEADVVRVWFLDADARSAFSVQEERDP